MSLKLRPLLLSAILSIVGLCFPAAVRGQFLGYTSAQTVTAKPFNNVTCPVAAQAVLVPNFGQQTHTVSVTQSAGVLVSMQLNVSGSNDGVVFFPISDILTNVPGTAIGSGYYSVFQVVLSCTGTAVLTVNYAGQSITPSAPYGLNLFAQVDKVFGSALPANAGFTSNPITPPFANSGGTLVFSYSGGAGPAGSSVAVKCNTAENFSPPITIASFPLATTATVPQTFSIPATPCPSLTVTYTSGGASAQLFTLEELFNFPGMFPTFSGSQPPGQSNTEQTSGANAAVSKTITGLSGIRAHVFSVSARCSAGTAQLTISDGGTQIWSTAATEVTATTFRFQWNPGLAAGVGNTMVVTLGTCGVANTGILDVQSSQF